MKEKLLVKFNKSSFKIDSKTTYSTAASKIRVNTDLIEELLNRNMLIGGIPNIPPALPTTTTTTTTTTTSTTTTTTTAPPTYLLTLGFDNITNAPVANPASVSDWNVFFGNQNKFISVNVIGNEVEIHSIGNLQIQNSFQDNTHTVSIDDEGCISSMNTLAFRNCTGLQSVNLRGDQITTIESSCFINCTALQSFYGPNITSISTQAFSGCTSLTNIRINELKNNSAFLGSQAFFNCSSLTSIYFPNASNVLDSCFEGCTSVNQIILPNAYQLGNDSGDNRVFFGITGKTMSIIVNPSVLTNNTGNTPDGDIAYLTTNNTISQIYSSYLQLTFDNTSSISSLVPTYNDVASWNTLFNLPSLGGVFTAVELFTGNYDPFIALKGGTNIALKANIFEGITGLIKFYDKGNGIITSIQDSAFRNCTGIIDLSFSVTRTIGNRSFQGCTNIDLVGLNKNISSMFPNVRSLGDYCFESFGANIPFTTQDNNNLICALYNVKTIGEYCFANTLFKNFPLLEVINVSQSAFENCVRCTEINLSSANSIGDRAFAGCIRLIYLGIRWVDTLGTTTGNNGVFENISGNNISIDVQQELFTVNNGLPDGDLVYLSANNSVNPSYTTSYPIGLSMQFPSSGSTLSFFGGSISSASLNTKFQTDGNAIPYNKVYRLKIGKLIVALEGGGVSMPNDTFKNNTDILSIEDKIYSIVNIGSEAFSGCTNLVTASFAVAVNYGSGSFKNCTSLAKTDFRYMHIASASAFENCTSITTFAGRDLKYAGDSAFKNTTSATTFNYPALVEVGNQCFSGSNNITTLNIPSLTGVGSTSGSNEIFSVSGRNIALTITGSSLADDDLVYLTTNNTITLDSPALVLTFDSTGSVQALVANTGSVADWNTFFNLPTNGTPFTSVQVIPNVPIFDNTTYAPQEYGCEVKLYGGKNITIAANRFRDYRKLRKLIDNGSTINRVGTLAFYVNQNWWNLSNQDPNLYGILEISLPACTYLEAAAFYGNMSTYRLNLPSVQYFGGNQVLWSTMAWYGSYSPEIENYSRVEDQIVSLPNLISIGTGMLANSYRVSSINVPQQTSIPLYSFAIASFSKTINIPMATSSGQQIFWNMDFSSVQVNMPNMTNLGGSTAFNNLWGGNVYPYYGTYRMPASLLTNNGGNPDGDVQAMIDSNFRGGFVRILTN